MLCFISVPEQKNENADLKDELAELKADMAILKNILSVASGRSL